MNVKVQVGKPAKKPVGFEVVLVVFLEEKNKPVDGKLVNFYQGANLLGQETTNLDGRAAYTVQGLGPGNYDFDVVIPGTTGRSRGVLTIEGPKAGKGKLVIRQAQNVLNIAVLDADGKPLSGKQVRIAGQNGPVLTNPTDANGCVAWVIPFVNIPAEGIALACDVPGGNINFVKHVYRW